jgi:uncharacterized protein YqkB
MNIQVTPLAERKLTERLGGKPGFFKLLFDTESCGCDGINVSDRQFIYARQQEV